MFNLKDYIFVFENIVSNELCEMIVSEYEKEEDWITTSIGKGTVDEDMRKCKSLSISNKMTILKNQKVRQNIDDELFNCSSNAIQKYNEKFPFAYIEQDEGYTLLRYKEGEFYKEHTDSYKLFPRSVSCVFALNDDYEGGEFAFFNKEVKYKLKKGSALMFPSSFMYPHEVLPVTKSVRYSIITWFL